MINRGQLLGKLRQWILGGSKTEDCKYLHLVHKDGDGNLKPVDGWEIEGDVDFDALATEITNAITGDAADAEEEEEYFLHAYFGDARPGSAGYGKRHRMKVYGTPKFDEGMDVASSSSNLTSPKQITGMATRMMLDLHKLTVPWANQMMLSYQRQIDSLQADNDKLRDQVRKGHIIQERLISRNHERHLRLRKVIFWEKQKEELAGIVVPMIPTMFSALAGKQLAAPRATSYTEALQRFISVVGPQAEKMQMLQKALKIQQYGPIAAIVNSVQQGKPIEAPVVVEFMKPVDDEQMAMFRQILSEEEFSLFVDIHRATFEEYQRRKQELDKAIADAENEMEDKPEEGPEPIEEEES